MLIGFLPDLSALPKLSCSTDRTYKCLSSQLWVVLSSEESKKAITGEPAITRERKHFSKIQATSQIASHRRAYPVDTPSLVRRSERCFLWRVRWNERMTKNDYRNPSCRGLMTNDYCNPPGPGRGLMTPKPTTVTIRPRVNYPNAPLLVCV